MAQRPTPFQALLSAIQKAGSQAKLAKICDVSSTAVWKWTQSSKRLPAEHVLTVETATGVPRNWLRPDIYPLENHAAPQPVADEYANILTTSTTAVACDNHLISQRGTA